MSTADILTHAANLIEKVGWGRGGDPEHLCVVEAIRGVTRTAVDAVLAYEALCRHLGLVRHRVTAGEVLISWNDRKATSQAEVVTALRGAANHLLADYVKQSP
jgi:hypothetical protein